MVQPADCTTRGGTSKGRVLLVQPHTMLDEPPVYPLGLAIVASCLHGWDIRLVDMNLVSEPEKALAELAGEFSPDVVGLSVRNVKNVRPGMHVPTLEGHRRAIQALKATAPGATMVVGGSGFSLYARRIMAMFPEVDFGVFGEGEIAFPELLDRLGTPEPADSVYYRRDGRVVFSGRRPRLDMDRVPAPRWDLLDPFPYSGEIYGVGVQTKRGCLMRCVHCSDLYLLGRRLLLRNPVRVVEEIVALKNRYGVDKFMFADQLFNVPQEHAMAICRELADRKLRVTWTAWFHEGNLSPELVRTCQTAGCLRMVFSPDAAHDSVLQALGKGITRSDLDHAVEFCRDAGMEASFNFMPNGPGEKVATVLALVGFLLKAKLRLGRLLRPAGGLFSKMRIYPHTRLHALALRRGLVRKGDDLLEPVFYDPYPLRLVVAPLRGVVAAGWRLRRFVRTLLRRGHRD